MNTNRKSFFYTLVGGIVIGFAIGVVVMVTVQEYINRNYECVYQYRDDGLQG